MTASWPAPSPSPTTPRPLTPSSAWNPRLKKTPPSLCTHRTPLCYRSVAPLKANSDCVFNYSRYRFIHVLLHSFESVMAKVGLFYWFCIILTGCKSHSDSLHPQCHPLHRWDPGSLPPLRSAGLPSAERQPGGIHCVVRSRTVQKNFN